MLALRSLKKAWALLDRHERANAFKVLAVMALTALSSAAMVGSVFPFLSVLADPTLASSQPLLAWAYQAGGFSDDYGFLVALGLGSLSLIVIAASVQLLNTWAITRYTQMRTFSLSRKLLAHYLVQPYEFHLNQHSGDMGANVLEETTLAVTFMRAFAGLVSALLTVVAVLGLLIAVSPFVALSVLAAITVLYAAITLATRGLVRAWGRRRAQANKQRYRTSNEAFSGIKDIKLGGYESTYLDRFSAPSLMFARLQTRATVVSQAPGTILQTFAFGGIIVLCLAFLDRTQVGTHGGLGEILPLLGLLAFGAQRLMPQMQAVYGALTEMNYNAAAVDRVYGDLSSGYNLGPNHARPAPIGFRHRLTLEETSYTYPNSDRSSLICANLTINAGERIGIVGSSGAGKTTLADVVLGLLVPDSGSVTVDGTKITDSNRRAWQRTLGYVPQDIFLLDASLAENIAIGCEPHDIDHENVERCARIAQLHAFVETELRKGYQTFIGERGVRLSGGQRQRVGIARALYHEADVIVFDEATSALDNLTEREVMASIDALPGDKTILMIAHRLTTVKACDRIVVMEQGRITACDRWEALIETSPVFKKITAAA